MKYNTKMTIEFIVENILDHKDVGENRLYLVKWLNYSERHNSWEPRVCLHNCHDLLDNYHRKVNLTDIHPTVYQNDPILLLSKDENYLSITQIINYLRNKQDYSNAYKTDMIDIIELLPDNNDQQDEQAAAASNQQHYILIGPKARIFLKLINRHIYVMFCNGTDHKLHLADGANHVLSDDNVVKQLAQPFVNNNQPIEIVKHGFNQQKLFDHCGTSAIAIGLEILRLVKNKDPIPDELVAPRNQLDQLRRIYHPNIHSEPEHNKMSKKIHEIVKESKCKYCNKYFKLRSSLRRHQNFCSQTNRVE